MSTVQTVIDQLDTLIAEYDALAKRSQHDDMSDLKDESRILANRLQASIDRLTVPSSTYARQADPLRTAATHIRLLELGGIVRALRDDLNAGWLESLVELVHADVHNDYLEMAEELLAKNYKDAAAVIAGSSLEVHIRALCVKHNVPVDLSGKPKKADVMNADLKKVLAYGALEQKQVTAWLGIRNSAAHGQYGDYVSNDVRRLIDGIRDFAAKYPA
ncbi:hypothetical protein [Amycolatopsis sp. CA-126428]|uniref:hypothetical protein n=1 Tax=Amycolatopsis sp. CA-126428 TaxID=2073158 RepID=UPI0011B0ADE7|nr:hypothetical protein [Amycolatopsis sp. CA-126428]